MLGKYELNQIYNEDCYEALKNIPYKSVDLVYIDIPYLFEKGGFSTSPLSQRIKKLKQEDLFEITNGIDYSIFDELCRIMKYIYIYLV